MGGAISKCGDTVDEVIYIQSPVAAAASTVLYSLQYGDGGGNGDDSADSIESPSGKADCDEDYVDEDDDYILGRLIFSDDEDFLVGVDSERMSVFDRHFQRTGHGRQSFWVGHSLRIYRITLNRNFLPFGVNMSRQGRSMLTMNVTSD
jgi:hypothetical protein